MEVFTTIAPLRAALDSLRQAGRRIGFVPTMGCLHAGHMALVREARRNADTVVVSIFVNPAQFGPAEDFNRYPRVFESDAALCAEAGVDFIFHPETAEMYRPGFSVWVEETELARGLCGARRPGHFRGVATVVAKLFNIVRPDVAVFGQKDYQQARIIIRMVEELDFPIRIIIHPTVREADGLALSSRNRYLAPRERQDALCLSRALRRASALFAAGERDAARLRAAVAAELAATPSAAVEYIEIVDAENLAPVAAIARDAVVALAVRIGATRLIDNAVLASA